MKTEKTGKELLESAKISKKLIEYGVHHNPYLYDIPIDELFNIDEKELKDLVLSNPKFNGLVELSSKHEDKIDKFWKWRTDIQKKVYLALLEEIEFQLEIRTLKRLYICERCPDPQLAKDEEHIIANRSYKAWLKKHFDTNEKSKISPKEYMLIWTNKLPVDFWKFAKNKYRPLIRAELRIWYSFKDSNIQQMILEGIEQLVNYKFVSEKYKNKNLEDDQLLRLEQLEKLNDQKKLNGKQHTLLVYYIANYEDEYNELKGLTASKKDKAKMIEFQKKHNISSLSEGTFRNYYCSCLNKKYRADNLDEDILEHLSSYKSAHSKAVKEKTYNLKLVKN